MSYAIHAPETASGAAKDTLERASRIFGFVPNMFGIMAGAPAVLESYQTVGALFDKTSLSATERQIVMLTTSVENGCEYCVSAHTAISAMQKVPDNVVQPIRKGQPIADPRLEALRRFTAEIVTSRGYPSEAALSAVVQAGFLEAQVLEIVLGVGLKTIANYINHIAETPLDEAFSAVAWAKATA